jgi:hypothetical protein
VHHHRMRRKELLSERTASVRTKRRRIIRQRRG